MQLCALAVFLSWFPVSDPGAWVTFTVIYLATPAVLTLLFNAKLSRETRELNEGLAEYRKSRETRYAAISAAESHRRVLSRSYRNPVPRNLFT